MSEHPKRFRQISIAESFALNKKKKFNLSTSVMSQKNHMRELLAASAEKRILAAAAKCNNLRDSNQCTTKGSDGISDCNLGFASTSLSSETDKLHLFDSDDSFHYTSPDLFPETQLSDPVLSYKKIVSLPSTDCSAELFSEEKTPENEAVSQERRVSEEMVQVSFLNTSPACSLPLPRLEPSDKHSIMFSPHIRPFYAPRPYPATYRDKWTFHHVRMPCSPQNLYPVDDQHGKKQIESRWDLICQSLRRDIGCSQDLEEAILQYNTRYKERWNFYGLHSFFERCFSDEEREYFFEVILPKMIDMALDLPHICTQPIPLLKKGKDHYVTISQKQIGCLLLNAFFCTFPRRNITTKLRQKWNSEYSNYPSINFNGLFTGPKHMVVSRSAEKLKCLINYFRRITTDEPCGTVTFHRQYLENLPNWARSTQGIKTAVVKSSGLIESDGQGMLQVDFANKYVGGGVLGHGCVQEEIRFMICPELIVSRLFVECLGPTEVLIITGAEQYNAYSGYSDGFKWESNYQDKVTRDSWGRKYTQVVAMDAIHFINSVDQFKPACIERELNKAFCGFYEDISARNLSAVATGNWGCGAFNGDPSLKFLIQLMAASQAGRSMLYFTFRDENLKKELQNIYNFVVEKNLSVGDLWRILLSYNDRVQKSRNGLCPTLHDFLLSVFSDQDDLITESKQDIDDEDLERLIEAVCNNDSSTEIEDNADSPENDPG